MTLLASLTNRIFLASALLAVITIALAIYLVSASVTREAEGEIARSLDQSATLLDEQRTALARNYLLLARLVADLPRIKGAVDTQDPGTVVPIIDDYQKTLQLDAEVLLLTDRHGSQLFAEPGNVGPPLRLPSVAGALAGRESTAFWDLRIGLLQVVSVPIVVGRGDPEVLGTLTAGFLLDDHRAELLKRTAGSDVAFVLDGRVVAATLPQNARAALAAAGDVHRSPYVRLGDEDYAVRAVPLRLAGATGASGGPTPVALVLRSRTSQLRALRTINVALLTTAALAIALATLLSFAVSRSVTRPLGAITGVMREVASTGDLTRKIPIGGRTLWQDEDARLLATTFNTLTDSVARFQRQAAERERLLALGRLSTVIAHEVRNPLMIIKGALRSLRPGQPDADQRDAVADIDEQVTRLNRIVHDVLDFSRPPRFDLAPADVARICEEAAAAVCASEPEGPAIHVSCAPARLVTDAERLRGALINLLANARQAVTARRREAAQGGASVPDADDDVAIEAGAGRGRVQVRVRDRGTGIAPEHLAHVFEPYFTTRRAGTGLGLPIARNIVEGLGGTIAVRAAAPGTIIEIELPVGGPIQPSPTVDSR